MWMKGMTAYDLDERADQRDPGPGSLAGIRIVGLCGSIRPLYSGTDDYADMLYDALRSRGADLRSVDTGSWGLTGVPGLLHAVRQEAPDVILMQYPTDAFGRRLGTPVWSLLQRCAPLVVTLHEFTATHPLRRLAVGALLTRARRVVATAEREAQGLAHQYPWLQDRIRVVPIGANIPPRHWAPVAPQQVVYFGQVRPNKGIEDFLACRDRLLVNFPHVTFRILGSPVPQFAEYCRNVMAAAKQRNVEVTSGLSAAEIGDALAAATVVVLPIPGGASFRRGSLLAAAVCGVPIVTTAGPDTPPDLAAALPLAHTPDEVVSMVARYLSDRAARTQAHLQSEALGRKVGWDGIARLYCQILAEAAR